MNHYTRYYVDGTRRRAPVADGTSFDGHLFSDHNIVVERIVDRLPDMREELAENNGRHGSSARSLRMSPRSISLECRYFTGNITVANSNGNMSDWYDYDAVLQYIGEFLYTPGDRRLVLRNHPGQYYMAHFSSMDEGDRDDQSAGFTLNFTASDPLRYENTERVLVVAKGASQVFDVGGTDEATLRIDVSGISGTRARVKLLHYGVDEYSLSLYDSPNYNMVTYDCVNHIAVADAGGLDWRTGLSLGASWPVLTPGRWRAEPIDGTATLTWRQAWR